MSSLAKREDLAGKVQMIYIDPPYGINYRSNFQPFVRNRDVKEKEEDLTREPEMIKAYRDTWKLGVHTYLEYLRDRLIVARELLADSGSIFVQIGDENVHRVRAVMDEVFGEENFVSQITFVKTSGFAGDSLSNVSDCILWYAKSKYGFKYRPLWHIKSAGDEGATTYREVGGIQALHASILERTRLATLDQLMSQGASAHDLPLISFGREFLPSPGLHWKTTKEGLQRLSKAERIAVRSQIPYYVRFLDDFAVYPSTNNWTDTSASFMADKMYVVQTTSKVIQRCILMTTDPGDLVLDPTCGSGTTAYVAEQWGRRWITIDTSRVAVALARQRILTARFDYFKTEDGSGNIGESGFKYKTVPHVTLGGIAQNVALDPIFAKWEPLLDESLDALNAALSEVDDDTRAGLLAKLNAKRMKRGRKSRVTDDDERRWNLPRSRWEHWEIPSDADPDYPPALRDALQAYRKEWRQKMDEVNSCIAANAEQEVLVDQPEVERGIVRVSGPFTVEAVQPVEESLGWDEDSPIGGSAR